MNINSQSQQGEPEHPQDESQLQMEGFQARSGNSIPANAQPVLVNPSNAHSNAPSNEMQVNAVGGRRRTRRGRRSHRRSHRRAHRRTHARRDKRRRN